MVNKGSNGNREKVPTSSHYVVLSLLGGFSDL